MGKDQELILAVRNHDVHFLYKVLQKNGLNKNTKSISCGHLASGQGKIDHRRRSEHRGSSKKVNVNYQDGDGYKSDQPLAMIGLTDVTSTTGVWMSGLHQAALMGHTEIMELLLENGASVNLKDNKGMIPLHYAAWQGMTEPVHILLQWKSPSNEQAQALETPLHLACQHGHFDVVNLLLLHQANPIITNKDSKTPLHLACEFGRYRVVDLLLRSNLCSPLLMESHNDMVMNKASCLHLAAKNGHSDIIRLLLQAGLNINRATLQGTCLHEAALFGKTDVVKLLLDCGVDVNKANSYDQTALDIVNKFTTSRASKEIKQLLKEASFSVQAKAIKDHCNICDPGTLTFREGDFIKIVEQRQDGQWKGTVMKDGSMAKPGWFPADHVVLIDQKAGKRNAYQISPSNVSSTPPLTPDSASVQRCHSFSFHGDSTLTSSRSSYGSVGHDEAFPAPPSPTCMSKFKHVNQSSTEDESWPAPPPDIVVSGSQYDLEVEDVLNNASMTQPPPPPPSYQGVVNNIPNHQNVNGKVIVNHVGEHCYIDNIEPSYQNAWDMRSSSPAGSNRNSAASSDSGRGLSTNYLDPKGGHHNYVNVQVNNHHRLSATSYESGVSSRQSYHSTSSSSVGSLDRLEESGYSSQINVADLFQAGVPDHEVLRAWLSDLRYEEYLQNFLGAGYDMPTITHMTPQDLTAIGISKPGHRKKLKAEIARLNIHDGIPDFKPNDLYDWLRMLSLEQYYNTLANQGFDNIDYVIDITWEDLEEIGIQKLGHQKKIMLAIDRLKRIMSGSKRLSTMDGSNRDSIEVLEPPMASIRWSGERSSPPPPAPPQYNELPPYLKPRRSSSGDSLSTNSSGEMKSLNQPLESEYANTSHMKTKPASIVPIMVKRSMSQSTPNGMTDAKESISPQKMCQSFHAPPDRNSDYSDRENTPTGDDMEQMSRSPINVAPVAPRVATKPKPIAKIIAKSKQSSREGSPDIIDIEKHEAERNNDGYKSPVKSLDGFKFPLASNGSLKRRTSEHIYDTPQIGTPRTVPNYVNYPPLSMHQVPINPGSPLHSNTGSPLHMTTGSPLHVNTQFDFSSQQMGSPRGSQGSPGGRAKKAPPPPPKRSASIRSVENHLNTTKTETSNVDSNMNPVSSVSSPTTSVLSPPPIQHKPQPSTKPQTQAFVNCVQSLSERFGKKSEDSACDNLSSDGEDLPPPPPPVAMDIITPKVSNYGLLGKSDKTHSGEYMLQLRLKREGSSSASPNANNGVESAFGVKLRQAELQSQSADINNGSSVAMVTESQSNNNGSLERNNGQNKQQNAQTCVQQTSENVTITKDNNNQTGLGNNGRKDSTGSGDNNISVSTTSLDSVSSIPFANENVGTIKQRTPTSKPSLVNVLDDSFEHESDSVFNDNSDTIKRTPNKLPKPQQQMVQHLQQQHQQLPLQQQKLPQQTRPSVAQQQQSNQGSLSWQQASPSYTSSVTASYIPGTQVSTTNKAVVRPSVPTKPGSTPPKPGSTPAKPGSTPTKPTLKPAVSPKPQHKGQNGSAAAPVEKTNGKSGDVLSEIDNMLQGLTDELDAMLEFELTK